MGKPIGKKKPQSEPHTKPTKHSSSIDNDTAVFIAMSQELKEEGNKLFQKRDYETAMLRFEKALKLLPKNHIDVANLRTNMASCYMQMGIGELPRAINECNLALEVSPKYSKALIRRAKCFQSLSRFDLAWRDVCVVLSMEPNNLMALEIRDCVRKALEENGIGFCESEYGLESECEVGNFKKKKLKIKKEEEEEESEKGLDSECEVGRLKKKKLKIKEEESENGLDSENGVGKKKKLIKKVKSKEEEESESGLDFSENDVGNFKKKKLIKKVKSKEEEKSVNGLDSECEVGNLKEKKLIKKEESESGLDSEFEVGKLKKKKLIKKKKGSRIEDKEVVVQEKVSVKEEKMVARTVKLVYGDDIRWAQIPMNCSLLLMRDIVRDRFPNLKGVLIKYRDQEGDFVTITTTDELRIAESFGGLGDSLRLYIAEVSPEQEPRYDKEKKIDDHVKDDKVSTCVDAWIVEFAQLFKTQVGFDSDSYMELHGVGMKLYSEAVEDVISTEEAQGLFNVASEKFQEMAALAFFNWGNVHMSKARKRAFAYSEIKDEYIKAGMRYDEALKIKPDFYEGFLALGQQQFEQAKLGWSYEESSSSEILQLLNKAEDNMETGMQMWEEIEERRLNGLSKEETCLEESKIMKAQILVLWGSLLYERSVVEFKLGLPTWEECLEVAVEKFELAGASNTDVAVMVKNHCAHQTAQEGLGFKIDEIVQAWHDMYDAKRWLLGVPSFRLDSVFRRRVPRLQDMLEQHV